MSAGLAHDFALPAVNLKSKTVKSGITLSQLRLDTTSEGLLFEPITTDQGWVGPRHALQTRGGRHAPREQESGSEARTESLSMPLEEARAHEAARTEPLSMPLEEARAQGLSRAESRRRRVVSDDFATVPPSPISLPFVAVRDPGAQLQQQHLLRGSHSLPRFAMRGGRTESDGGHESDAPGLGTVTAFTPIAAGMGVLPALFGAAAAAAAADTAEPAAYRAAKATSTGFRMPSAVAEFDAHRTAGGRPLLSEDGTVVTTMDYGTCIATTGGGYTTGRFACTLELLADASGSGFAFGIAERDAHGSVLFAAEHMWTQHSRFEGFCEARGVHMKHAFWREISVGDIVTIHVSLDEGTLGYSRNGMYVGRLFALKAPGCVLPIVVLNPGVRIRLLSLRRTRDSSRRLV